MASFTLGFSGIQYENENERKRKDRQILDLAQELKKAVEHEFDVNDNCNWRVWSGLQIIF